MRSTIHNQVLADSAIDNNLVRDYINNYGEDIGKNVDELKNDIMQKIITTAFDSAFRVISAEVEKGEDIVSDFYFACKDAEKRKMVSSSWNLYMNTMFTKMSLEGKTPACPAKILDTAGSIVSKRKTTRESLLNEPAISYVKKGDFGTYLGELIGSEIPNNHVVKVFISDDKQVDIKFNEHFYVASFNAVSSKSSVKAYVPYLVKFGRNMYLFGVEYRGQFYPYATQEISDPKSEMIFSKLFAINSFSVKPALVDHILNEVDVKKEEEEN